jgi:hypothetical protein
VLLDLITDERLQVFIGDPALFLLRQLLEPLENGLQGKGKGKGKGRVSQSDTGMREERSVTRV